MTDVRFQSPLSYTAFTLLNRVPWRSIDSLVATNIQAFLVLMSFAFAELLLRPGRRRFRQTSSVFLWARRRPRAGSAIASVTRRLLDRPLQVNPPVIEQSIYFKHERCWLKAVDRMISRRPICQTATHTE